MADNSPQSGAVRCPAAPLPAFPTEPLGSSEEVVKGAYYWADLMIFMYREGAATAVQMMMTKALENQDLENYRGWANVAAALAEWWRWPSEAEEVN